MVRVAARCEHPSSRRSTANVNPTASYRKAIGMPTADKKNTPLSEKGKKVVKSLSGYLGQAARAASDRNARLKKMLDEVDK